MNVSIYHADDWSALYVNNKSVWQAHTIRLMDLQVQCPNVPVGAIKELWVDSAALTEYADLHGAFPDTEPALVALLRNE